MLSALTVTPPALKVKLNPSHIYCICRSDASLCAGFVPSVWSGGALWAVNSFIHSVFEFIRITVTPPPPRSAPRGIALPGRSIITLSDCKARRARRISDGDATRKRRKAVGRMKLVTETSRTTRLCTGIPGWLFFELDLTAESCTRYTWASFLGAQPCNVKS